MPPFTLLHMGKQEPAHATPYNGSMEPVDPPSRAASAAACTSRPTDTELIERCLAGDQRAWAGLVERYNRLVFSIPWRYGLDPAACDDVFQEVWSILLAKLGRIERRTALPQWLMTTTHRVCRLWVRRAGRAAVALPAGIEAEATVVDQVDAWERQQLLREALGRLGPPCEPLLMALYMGQARTSYQEVADRLGIPVGSVGPTRARCLKKLLAIMEEEGDAGP